MSTVLSTSYDSGGGLEIGVDEAGRGPLFGRVYAAAVILPKVDDAESRSHLATVQGDPFAHLPCDQRDFAQICWGRRPEGMVRQIAPFAQSCSADSASAPFAHHKMKDSKRFHSKTKLRQVAQYIRDHPDVKYSIQYVEPDVIDCINIRQAVLRAMHDAIRDVLRQLPKECVDTEMPLLMIDGNDFRPYSHLVGDGETWKSIPHVTVEGGDNRYTCIAAASILAKVAHDDYIADLCREHPELAERYHLDKNVGYGTRQHLEGIQKYGITKWHRKSFARCKGETVNNKDPEEFDETLP